MRADFYKRIEAELNGLKESGTHKSLKYNTGILNSTVNVEGCGDVIVLCSNNYLGLAGKAEVIDAAKEALTKYGAGASSVRFICGTYDIHRRLERRTAEFLGLEDALTYTSCWAANTAAIPALLGENDAVISDELNHASIIDGCRMTSRAVKRCVYKHSDMTSLEEKLIETAECGTALIVTDGVFSMEGDVANLPGIIALAQKYGALVMLDDSHATGVIGSTGRGTMEYYGITEGVDIISGTYGKALGGAGGGFIAARENVCDVLIQRSRPHLFSNSLPPVLCAVALAAIDFLDNNPAIVASLKKKTNFLRRGLKENGVIPIEGDAAIVPVIIGDTAKAISISEKMLKKGVYTIGFGYPVVPEGTARIRMQVSDALSENDLDLCVTALTEAMHELCS